MTRPTWALCVLACASSTALAGACSSSGSGPTDTSACASGLAFSTMLVPISAVASIPPIGGMGPPIHTIPTDHGGFYLNGTGITVVTPAAARVNEIGRTRYLRSPFRQGQSDYSVTAQLCGSYQYRLGHVITLVDRLATQVKGNDCRNYSTANESVESCQTTGLSIELAAGETIGTVGSPTSGAFDLGLYDANRDNFFVNPSRYSGFTRTAICPYDPFPADVRTQLFSRLSAEGVSASGETPVCGSMSVDVAGSVRGVWVLQSNPVNQAGDETNFLVLAPHPMRPQSRQTFSAGPAAIAASLGAPQLARYPIQASGRVNRAFQDVHADGLIYCYAADIPAPIQSYYLRLATGTVLTIQKVTHPPGATPCAGDPAGWSFGPTALSFIR